MVARNALRGWWSDSPADLVAMELPEDAILLRIFIGESDRHRNRPLYEAIVLKARELQMAGATMLRGPMGYGASSRIHTANHTTFPGFAFGRGNRGHRGQDQWFPAVSRRDDERWTCDARKGQGDSLRARKKEARSCLRTALRDSFLWRLPRLLSRMWSHAKETDCFDNSRWLGN